MIFDTPYDTTTSNYSLKTIQQALVLAMSADELTQLNPECHKTGDQFSLYLVTDQGMHSRACPLFNHPIPIYNPQTHQSGICVDMRAFGTYDQKEGKFKIRSYSDAQWTISRAQLTDYWISEDKGALRDASLLPMEVYSSMISQTVARRYNLEPGDQVAISILAGYYYHCLFEDLAIIDEVDLMKIASKISRGNKVSTNQVFDKIKDLGVIDSLEDFCKKLAEFTGNIRLQDFNSGVLLQIVCGNWYGANARENLAVALEHPPTWWTICYFSLFEATFKRSTLAKMVQTKDKGGEGDRFMKIYESIVDKDALKALSE